MSNISREEDAAIRSSKSDSKINVLPANKENGTTVMNQEEYGRKIEDLLDSPTYKKLKLNPTSRVAKKTNALASHPPSIRKFNAVT